MQTLHRLRRFRDLRAVSPGAKPPADGVPSPALSAPDQEARSAFPNPSSGAPPVRQRNAPLERFREAASPFAVGSRPAAPVALIGTGPESGAVPRGRQGQRAIRLRLSRERGRLPDRVCRAVLVRQTMAHPGDGPVHHWQHDRPPVGEAACLPVCALACSTGWPAGSLPVCMAASLPVRRPARLCPSPDR